MNIIVPLAGEGRRFAEAGFPEKPFVMLNGKPPIQVVLESLPKPWLEKGNFIFVTKPEYVKRLRSIAKELGITYSLKETGPTRGAACSTLLAKDLISTVEQKNPLIILNGDQIVDFSLFNFNTLANFLSLRTQNVIEVGGVVLVFKSTDPKWSYVEMDNYSQVVRVAEKEPVSEWATCGIYLWTSTSAFFECAENMIYNERKVNNEYYVAPVYNEILKFRFQTGVVYALEVEEMISLGTPEDVRNYLVNNPH